MPDDIKRRPGRPKAKLTKAEAKARLSKAPETISRAKGLYMSGCDIQTSAKRVGVSLSTLAKWSTALPRSAGLPTWAEERRRDHPEIDRLAHGPRYVRASLGLLDEGESAEPISAEMVERPPRPQQPSPDGEDDETLDDIRSRAQAGAVLTPAERLDLEAIQVSHILEDKPTAIYMRAARLLLEHDKLIASAAVMPMSAKDLKSAADALSVLKGVLGVQEAPIDTSPTVHIVWEDPIPGLDEPTAPVHAEGMPGAPDDASMEASAPEDSISLDALDDMVEGSR